jgi:hypothetical protein
MRLRYLVLAVCSFVSASASFYETATASAPDLRREAAPESVFCQRKPQHDFYTKTLVSPAVRPSLACRMTRLP